MLSKTFYPYYQNSMDSDLVFQRFEELLSKLKEDKDVVLVSYISEEQVEKWTENMRNNATELNELFKATLHLLSEKTV